MNLNRKNICGLMLVVLGRTAGFAQEINVSTLGYFTNSAKSLAHYDSNTSMGYGVGVGYRYYLGPKWSIGAEVNYQHTNLDLIQRNAKGSLSTTDMDNDTYEFRYKAQNLKEQVSYNTLQIPITIQYETQGTVRWYVQTGVGIGILTGNQKSTIKMNDLRTSGYYPEWNAELNGPSFMGFGSFGHQKQEVDLKLENRISWLFETGIKQDLGNKQSLYIGAFVDLGLNDMGKNIDKNNHIPVAITSDLDNPLAFSSLWTQTENKNNKLQNYNVGIKLRYSFNL